MAVFPHDIDCGPVKILRGANLCVQIVLYSNLLYYMSDTLKYDTVWKLTWPTVKYNYETILLRRLKYDYKRKGNIS